MRGWKTDVRPTMMITYRNKIYDSILEMKDVVTATGLEPRTT